MTGGSNGWAKDKHVNYLAEDPIFQIQEWGLDVKAHQVYLVGESTYAEGGGEEGAVEPGVEYIMANRFVKNMNILMRKTKSTDPILIHMKTCGGDWQEGMAIYDMIKSMPNPVTILNYTHARSMSSLIFLAANKRVMMPNACYMIHDGTYGIDSSPMRVVRSNFEFYDTVAGEKMLDIYVKALKEQGKYKSWSKQRIRDMLRSEMDKKEDVFYTAEEAVAVGYADEIFGQGPKGYDWGGLIKYTEKQLAR